MMIKIIFSIAVLMAISVGYWFYDQQQQHKQHVASIVNEAQTSLKQVQQNPHYQNRPVQIRPAEIEAE